MHVYMCWFLFLLTRQRSLRVSLDHSSSDTIFNGKQEPQHVAKTFALHEVNVARQSKTKFISKCITAQYFHPRKNAVGRIRHLG